MGERGHVYIMHNCSFPQVKIGKTSRTVEERAKELSSTSVPQPFIPLFSVEVADAGAVEKRLHDRFSDFRGNPRREFFYLTPQVAINALLEEVGLISSPARSEVKRIDITDQISIVFRPLLNPSLHRVFIEYTENQQTLECHLATNGEVDVSHRDVTSHLLMQALNTVSAERAVSLVEYLQEDVHYLALTTPIFSSEGRRLVLDIHSIDQKSPDLLGATPDRVVQVICKRYAAKSKITFEQIRKDFNLTKVMTDAVGVHELHGGQFVLSNRTNGWLWNIHVESIDRDDDLDPESPRSYAIINEPYLDELRPSEAAIVGHRYSEYDWTSAGPEISVSGRTSNGEQFLQTFSFPTKVSSTPILYDIFNRSDAQERPEFDDDEP